MCPIGPPAVQMEGSDVSLEDLPTMTEFEALAQASELRKIFIGMDCPLEFFLSAGPRRITSRLAQLLPEVSVLVTPLSQECDDPPPTPRTSSGGEGAAVAQWRDHAQPSVLHDVFLPGLPQAWLADARRRGPEHVRAADKARSLHLQV